MPTIILHQPKIPPNTGNIIRLSANCGFDLHLIEPLGFSLDKKSVRRAGLDYSELAQVQVHKNLQQCLIRLMEHRLVLVSTRATQSYSDFQFSEYDALLFGNETSGLPESIWKAYASAECVRIPMRSGNRSINLSNAVAIVAWACWQNLRFDGAS